MRKKKRIQHSVLHLKGGNVVGATKREGKGRGKKRRGNVWCGKSGRDGRVVWSKNTKQTSFWK